MQFSNSTNKENITFNANEIKKSDNYNCKCKSVVYKTIKSENYETLTIKTDNNINSYDF